jgi:two-component system, LytTR family, sensor kinase
MRRVAVAFLLWTAIAVVFATQLYFAGLPWSRALAWTLPRWYAWGLVAPGIFAVDRRLARVTSFTNRVILHVPLAGAWTSLTILLRLVRRGTLTANVPNDVGQFFLERFYSDLPIYAVLVGISVARQFARQKSDLERELVEAQLQTLRAQLQPHFLFNALNTISSFTESNPQTARRLMAQLGDLLRRSLRHAAQSTVPLGEELTFLDDFLAIESARFEDRLRVTVRVDDAALPVMVPSFLLQPIVENAIRHGSGARVSGGQVDVTAAREGSSVHIRVRDDGLGLPSGWTFDRGAGIGLRNVAARLEHLYGRKDLLRVNRIASGGVEVHIEVPIA